MWPAAFAEMTSLVGAHYLPLQACKTYKQFDDYLTIAIWSKRYRTINARPETDICSGTLEIISDGSYFYVGVRRNASPHRCRLHKSNGSTCSSNLRTTPDCERLDDRWTDRDHLMSTFVRLGKLKFCSALLR